MMKISRASIAVAFGLAMATAAHGRLGETKEECADRYGEPTGTTPARLAKSDPKADVFKFAGIDVTVEYREGEAWSVSYGARKMNQTNADKILANYGADAGAKWEGPTQFSNAKHWSDTKGGRHAVLYGSPQFKLVVFAEAAVDAAYRPIEFLSEKEEEEPAPEEEEEEEEGEDEPKPEKKDPFDGF